jgi:hypothetical protein
MILIYWKKIDVIFVEALISLLEIVLQFPEAELLDMYKSIFFGCQFCDVAKVVILAKFGYN